MEVTIEVPIDVEVTDEQAEEMLDKHGGEMPRGRDTIDSPTTEMEEAAIFAANKNIAQTIPDEWGIGEARALSVGSKRL